MIFPRKRGEGKLKVVMMKPNRPHVSKGGTYPPEFREEAVRYWLWSGQTLKAVSSDLSDLGVTPECLRTWRRQMEAIGPVAPFLMNPWHPVAQVIMASWL